MSMTSVIFSCRRASASSTACIASWFFTFARGAVRKMNNQEAMQAVDEALARRQLKITEVMDILWTIQEVVFDLMLPWRTELPEDVEVEGDELALNAGIWREFRLHP